MTEVVYTIGPGVQQCMTDHNDTPRSNEIYVVQVPGHTVSQTYGRDALYVWYEEDNAVQRCPFR